MKEFNWSARVYYEDTDAGGVVYHARYLAFYERARTELLRQLGISQHKLLQESIAFVVKKMDISYHFPARLDDLLTINSKVDQIRKASIIFKQTIINENNQVISSADVIIACVDITKMKPCGLPKSLVLEFI
ncbi:MULTISPECIES: tol-pal system-associated acyl-CoA thioesterase [unclassified Gilliamella]|uniref:tol-pal system-associated acyl-CoA thioesterase n=1 Tax=unclassified Gilliamella TaxID=2685620 RepID=UPI00226A2672|nr:MULTISPECIES: tol-pal system-associated acyl-CoA thioesterase [unclassified Gilliamella]MCX8574097.1 tol-pal system-associated acyl-CoA thioesterase [Gilliamella sp. B3831]MCX8576328.1 tol-pal system-associated acyl-CoA thioesterase [Gilliamella sp. B3815]MCX8578386.1 tol-pal system-associated acyl-CoA thioesterase [Gilliamella sp. B2717]MCX8603429.1 tol-pal system-associated acyl-CoA thioesterase [Gilliamella sp. B3823]MCX8606954.1 tol-pal system-associated acyl-CoA thioesterase [Gilliamel